jgi:ELWxxDGT repeat protein
MATQELLPPVHLHRRHHGLRSVALAVLLPLACAGNALAAAPYQVKDVWPGPAGSFPIFVARLGGVVLFSADSETGRGLWKTDGTSAGTVLLEPFALGSGGAVVNGFVYFAADDGVHGFELWRTDGTSEGTTLVKDILPGSASCEPSRVTSVGDILIFTTNLPSPGLWRSDGTAAGTVMISGVSAQNLVNVNGTVFFSADDKLYKTDGSAAGTVVVSDVRPASETSVLFANANGVLYFSGDDGTHGFELWKSDGTNAGTVMVKDITAGSASSNLGTIAVVGDQIFFAAGNLWKTDGTEAGTTKVDTAAGVEIFPSYDLVALGGKLLFAAYDENGRPGLWTSDGSTAGTFSLKGFSGQGASGLAVLNGRLFFGGEDAATGRLPRARRGSPISIPGPAGHSDFPHS